MLESGGPTTQAGIFYQNSIAALYIGRMCDMGRRPSHERVIEVRVEAPTYVDDIVVTYADQHRKWVQVKEDLRFWDSDKAWKKLWKDFEEQRWSANFGLEDRLVLVLGTNRDNYHVLRELCERAHGSLDFSEWNRRLTKNMSSLKEQICSFITAKNRSDEAVFELFSFIDVQIIPLQYIEHDDVPRWMPASSVAPMTLFRLLRDRCGGQARNREVFRAPNLLAELEGEHRVSVLEPQTSGAPAYRDTIFRNYSRLEVPGTNLSGDISQLFLWPVLQEVDLASLRLTDIEDEDPRYQQSYSLGTVDVRSFPNSTLKRAVVVAGAGFGKTTLLTAIAHRLSSTLWLPVLVPLPELAESGETILEFLKEEVNRKFDVQVLWDYYCDNGRAVILFDGLDELTPRDRRRVLHLIGNFSSRHPEVPWLLTVRDAKALSAPVEANTLRLDVLDYKQIHELATAYREVGSSVDVSELLSQIQAYPDLALLTRIPLFLALLLATTRTSEPLPRRRSDLIERYLYVVLHPDEYKPSLPVVLDPTELREVAERLAFTALEQGKTSLTEVEITQILRPAEYKLSTSQYIEALQICGIVRRSVERLSFAFPVVQEYLAAKYLVTHFPDQLTQRFSYSARRPWAQMLQFALERHPAADQVIEDLLEHADDAFGTTLRLIGQCIVNGARISTTLRNRVGHRLGELWESLPYTLRENIGKMIAHGFTSPLPPNVRASLVRGCGLQSGGDDIVLACNDADLSRAVLEVMLAKDPELHSYPNAFCEIANTIAPEALQLCIQRAKGAEQGTVDYFKRCAARVGVPPENIHGPIELTAQFRAAGNSDFVKALDEALYEEIPAGFVHRDFAVQVDESVEGLEAYLRDKMDDGYSGRLLAGFCWEWSDPKRDGTLVDDVRLGPSWSRPWNRKAVNGPYSPDRHPYTLWANREENQLGEVGCIYSVQGFEFDYVGVIWGPDLVWRDGRWVARPEKSLDPGINGRNGPIPEKKALPLLKNAYRVLCSRAMTGCSVFCLDEETAEYLRRALGAPSHF